jgi:hypothetical protein
MAVASREIKLFNQRAVVKMHAFGLRLGVVRLLALAAVAVALAGCRVLTTGLPGQGAPSPGRDAAIGPDTGDVAGPESAGPAIDVGEPPGVDGAPIVVGCSDGTREGFRDVAHWLNIAGCAGAFDQPGVIGSPDLLPACELQAGDTSANPSGAGCSAADLCAQHWHLCRDGTDVSQHSPTGGCESCVPAGEPRFFLVAAGASAMGICSPDPQAANDLHGCGGLGQPESDGCAPLVRRMGFADCLATHGVWSCGTASDSLREAAVVTKREITLGGVLCCRD